MKNMYAIKCIYKSSLYKLDDNSEINYPNQFEERIFLIKAKSLEDADSKCEKYALEYEDSYINPYGEIVKTTLYEILDVYQIFDTNKKNNIEVYSNIFYNSEKQLKKSLAVNHPIRNKKINKERFLNVEFEGFDESVDNNIKKVVNALYTDDSKYFSKIKK